MLKKIFLNTFENYPLMQLQDFIKLIFQNNFGSDHLCLNKQNIHDRLSDEWERTKAQDTELFTDIGNGFSRLNICAAKYRNINPCIIEKLFSLSTNDNKNNKSDFYKDVEELRNLCREIPMPFKDSDIDEFIKNWEDNGFRPISHSQIYKTAYKPSYRIVKTIFTKYIELIVRLSDLCNTDKKTVVAIDGRCASGKSTLAKLLFQIFDCTVIHADDFFLPLSKRTSTRLNEPGGNLHYERFNEEVIKGIKSEKIFTYRKYVCHKNEFESEITVLPNRLTVIEGSYSLNPHIEDIYDIKVFLTTGYNNQIARIKKRNGEAYLTDFKNRWIPYEENYFKTFQIAEKCDFVFNT